MKNLIYLAVIIAFTLVGCEKQDDDIIAPEADTVYVDPVIGIVDFETSMTDIIILEDADNANNVNAHAAGNCKVILDNYNISLTVNATKEIAPDNMPTVYYFFEYEIQLDGYDEDEGIVYGSIKHDTDSGEFLYKNGKFMELTVNNSQGTYKLYIYNK